MGDGGRREPRAEEEAGETWAAKESAVGAASPGPGAAGTLDAEASHRLCPPGLQDDGDLQALLKGSQLLKVKSSSWRRERFYKLQEDCKTIWQESRKVMRTPESQLCECPGAAGWGPSGEPVLACVGKLTLVGVGGEVRSGPGPQKGTPGLAWWGPGRSHNQDPR